MNTQTVGAQQCCAPTNTMCNQPDLILFGDAIAPTPPCTISGSNNAYMHYNADFGDFKICAIACLLHPELHYGCYICAPIALA